mmetsp:Transcript_132375/g.382686  ORF Transcript_132375/g.382686 Transcript_132375/m.382686 type:complete len:755 (-) Transcript_132375:28-2292(-)|eukprot:CAMPEP_0176046384 /NCGR_PEP_ID=MMETSP0120_2-20121206/23031_1 /TAXON_ID=160619 /ORGANISM="Kryptoperidinium foliaceum, Strain CCMP 1326" /LENGTH=754 /DNA_ID=CAMNT_0017379795 /DNA_START=33 /DNA_END=2297 /DNA_ORIENTATION=-
MAEKPKKATGLEILRDEKAVNDLLEQKSGAKAMIRSGCNLALFVSFLVLFTALALSEPLGEHRAFEGYLRRRFDTMAAMPLRKVESVSTFWEYMDRSFMPAIYGNDTRRFYFPGHQVARLLQIEEGNRLLGVVRLRMLKVVPGDACHVKGSLEQYFPTCYGAWDPAAEDTAPFGPPNPQTGDPEFSYFGEPGGSWVEGKIMSYPPGGFMEALTADHNLTTRRLTIMKENAYAGPGLRAMIVDWSIYNFNIGAYGVCRILFEVAPSGLWVSSFEVDVLMRRHLSPLGGRTTGDWLVLLGEVILVLFVLRYLIEEAAEFVGFRGWRPYIKWDYFGDAWNILDWLNLILMIATLGLRVKSWGMSGDLNVYIGDPSKQGVSTFTDLQSVASNVRVIHQIIAFNTVLTWFKAVKYISVLPYITTFMQTVSMSQKALGTFIVIFGTLFFGFIIAYTVAFGENSAVFRTPWSSFVFLMRSYLGNSDFSIVYNAAPIVGSVLTVTYILLMIMVIANLFYAIMIRALADMMADEDPRQKNQWQQTLERMNDLWRTVLTQFRLEYRFRTCFPGLYARIMSRRRKIAEREKERDEEVIKRIRRRKPDASVALGPGNPSLGRRQKLANYSITADDIEESDNESDVDLGPLRDKAQLSKKGMFGSAFDPDAGDHGDAHDDGSSGWHKDTSSTDDGEPPPEAIELVIEATRHVVDGIVDRTYGARGVLIAEMQESKNKLLMLGSVLEVLGRRARDLEAQQQSLLKHFG